jgi:hypothetical protein
MGSNGESTTTNPYVGPIPFSTEKKAFFFGRDDEAARLLALAISERIVLFYAQSGSGKSSLINAKLIPDLVTKGYKVLPVARVGGDLPSDIPAERIDNVFVFNTLLSLAETKKTIFGERKDVRAQIGKSLTDYVREQRLTEERKQHWLIFDQFEEIITTHPSQDLEKRKDFFRQLKQMLDVDEFLSLVVVMREDHLAGIDSFVPFLPELVNTRYRIERLKRKQALDAVRLPALKGGRTFATGAAEHLVNDLSQERIADQETTRTGEYVEPLFLQLVCFSLWKSLDELKAKKSAEQDKVITKQDVETYGDIDTALKKFYSDAVKRVAERTDTTEMAIRRWFGETLITPTGIRAQVDRGLLKSGRLSNKAVDQLLGEEHLIRLEEARGGKWYELSHDRFVKPVLDSNEEWLTGSGGDSRMARTARLWNALGQDESFLYRSRLLQKAQAKYEKNKESFSPLEVEFLNASTSAEAKRVRQYSSLIAALAVSLVIAIIFGASYGYTARRKNVLAAQQKELAETHLREIEEKNRIETRLRAEAEDRGNRLKSSMEYSEKLRTEAEAATKKAEAATKKEKELRLASQRREVAYRELFAKERKLRQEYEQQSSELRNSLSALQASRDREKELETELRRDCDPSGTCKTTYLVTGEVRWKYHENGNFEFLGEWANGSKLEKNVNIPQLRDKSKGANVPASIDFYKPAVPQLKAAFAELEQKNLLTYIKSWDGSTDFYESPPRRTRPNTHSIGIAFDINRSAADRPPQGSPDRLPKEVIDVFEKHGFKVTPLGVGAHVELIRLD